MITFAVGRALGQLPGRWRAALLAPFLVLCLWPRPAAADGGVLTLGGALRATAARSQAAVAAGLDVDAAREATNRVKAAYLPSLSISGGWYARDNPVVAIFGDFAVPTTQKNFVVGDVSLTQLVWDGGRRSAARSASEQGEAAVAARGRAEVLGAQLEALNAYLTVLVLRAQRGVVEQRVASLEAHLREARDLYDQGQVARSDVLATEVRLRSVRDRIPELDDGAAVAAEALSRLVGNAPGETVVLEDALPAPRPLPQGAEALRPLAAARSPRLVALRARLEAERQAADLKRREDFPSLFAQASHTYQQNEYLEYPHANVLFVGVSWSAWDGGARAADRRKADLGAERTSKEIADAEKAVAIEVDRASRELDQALREAGTAEENSAAAAETLRIVEDQYRAGVARSTEVLDAETVLAESRFAAVSQRYAAYFRQGVLLGLADLDLPSFFEGAGPAGEEK